MPDQNRHVISQQILQLDVSPGPDIHQVLQAVSQRLRTHTMPEIEALFDRCAGPGQTIRLERVEVDLGNLQGIDWQQQFESRLVSQMTAIVEKASAGAVDESPAAQAAGGGFGQFLYFLDHGRLPGGTALPSVNWSLQWLQQLGPAQWRSLRAALTRSEYARRRLVHTLDDATLVAAVEKLLGLRKLRQVLNLWITAELARDQRLLLRPRFWLALLDPVTGADGREPGIEIMRRLLRLRTSTAMSSVVAGEGPAKSLRLPAPWHEWLAKVQQGLAGPVDLTPKDNIGPLPTRDFPAKRSAPGETTESTGKRPGAPALRLVTDPPRAAASGVGDTAGLPGNPAPPNSLLNAGSHAADSATDNTGLEKGEAIPVGGAGCIILHPFLEELFRKRKWLDDRDFRDDASRHRAVHLLSYLTFGDEAPAEYELLLPKLLCGMAWREPLPVVELADEDRLTCEQLLDAVIGHWQALKGCSANWLREQFLLRTASLEPVDDGWRLAVDRRAQDVLLDRLPWGLGVISLPWRHGLIYVRWME